MKHSRHQLLLLVILSAISLSQQDTSDNSIDVEDDDPLAEITNAIFKEQNMDNVGSIISNLVQSDSIKQMGNQFLNKDNMGQMLQGLGSLMGGNGDGLNPSMLGNIMNMMMNSGKKGSDSDSDSGFDMGSVLSLVGSLAGNAGLKQNPLETLQMVVQTVSSFVGPEADARAKSHEKHAWVLPPVVEKLHILFDHFMHSDIGKMVLANIGAEKFVKIFQDDEGKLSYQKFVDMLENHSFRKHWIKMVTARVAKIVTYMSDPVMYKKYLTTVQHFVNSMLKNQGFPKTTYFDPNRPTETVSALINYISKNYFGIKLNSKQYVKPAIEYLQDLMKLAQKKGLFTGSSTELSDKLADTINMEVIEAIARVNRAYRFAKKVPKCDKYVMCLVNHETPEANPSLPGLRSVLSKGTSVVMSWFMSSYTETPFLTLYAIIMDEDENCKALYNEKCHDFHLEEIKVTTEYVHSEL